MRYPVQARVMLIPAEENVRRAVPYQEWLDFPASGDMPVSGGMNRIQDSHHHGLPPVRDWDIY